MAGKTSRTSKASMTQQGPQCDRPETKLNGVMGPARHEDECRWSRQTWRPGAADTKSHLDWTIRTSKPGCLPASLHNPTSEV